MDRLSGSAPSDLLGANRGRAMGIGKATRRGVLGAGAAALLAPSAMAQPGRSRLILLGTGGAVRFALDEGALDGTFCVLYGDRKSVV